MKVWHAGPTLSAAMPFQMAFDEVLLRSSIQNQDSIPFIRFYFSAGREITVGYSHRTLSGGDGLDRLTANASPPDGVRVTKRLTGGGIVEHGKDLIFSVIAPKIADDSFKSVRMSYLKIHEALKHSLETFGLEIRFYRCDEKLPRGAECFSHPIATDLAWKNEKIAGGAQKRSAGYFLHQESVRLVAGIQAQELIKRFRQSIETRFEVSIRPYEMDPDFYVQARELSRRKYGMFADAVR